MSFIRGALGAERQQGSNGKRDVGETEDVGCIKGLGPCLLDTAPGREKNPCPRHPGAEPDCAMLHTGDLGFKIETDFSFRKIN